MQLLIQKKIEEEAKKRLSRPFQNLELSRFDAKRFEKRTGLVAPVPTLMRPPIWDAHKHFDPAYCVKHSKFLAKGIWKSLLSGNYSPNPSWRVNIPKSNGDMRPIDIMSIPDSAVSSVMYSNLIERNQRHFSAFSFAFRKDKGIFDAIEKIMHAISYPSLYVVNYDFSDFFGSINHEYLLNIIQEKRYFRFSKLEKNYLARLIKHQYGTISQFSSGDFDERNVGIPQGSSISLFLANIAAHELDMELERRNGSFARYSDDVVVICNSYEDSVGLKNVFHDFSQKSGISINKSKYQGVRILSNFIEEMRSVVSFDFLGYNFSKSGVVVSEKKVRAWKRRCAEIIYNNLLFYLHPSRSLPINHRRIGGLHHDWDLVQCINELRRYIYGGTKEHLVTGWLEDRVSIGKMRGVTAHFCMVNRNEQFSELDGWLLNVLKRALRRREVLLRTQGVPYAVPDGTMILDGTWYRRASPRMETQLPSFSRAWRASRKRWLRHGYKGISDDWKIYEE